VLVGLLAAARLTTTLAAWEPGSGFSLMGAGRDLMFSVFNEPLLLLSLTLVAMQAGSTSLVDLTSAGRDGVLLARPAGLVAALGFALVMLVETGRQPIDNPDTHLELTLVHEGPLLEYAGRDLAMLLWSAAARHWVVLVLAAGLFVPSTATASTHLAAVALTVVVACGGLALVESSFVKLRILRVPALLGTGMAACVLGLAIAITTRGGA
jgi:formate hydrogenlyase subunit 4